jgi:hypothetical protein
MVLQTERSGWRLEGEERKGLIERRGERRGVLIVRMDSLVKVRMKRLAKSSPTLAKRARMGHPNSF